MGGEIIGNEIGGLASGAVGGVVGEATAMVADELIYDGKTNANSSEGQKKIIEDIGTAAAQVTTGLDADTAAQTAGNAIKNNYLTPKQLIDAHKASIECDGDVVQCRERIYDDAIYRSFIQDTGFRTGEDSELDQNELAKLADITVIEGQVREAFPTYTEEQVSEAAIKYQFEYLDSLDEKNLRVVVGTVEAVAEAMPFVGKLVKGATSAARQPATKELIKRVAKKFAALTKGSRQTKGLEAAAQTTGTALAKFPEAKAFSTAAKFKDHWKRHVMKSNEWGMPMSQSQYLNRARKFLSGPPGKDVMQYTRPNGAIVRYSKRTGEFGIVDKNGTINTLFRPASSKKGGNGLDYFLQDRLDNIGH